MPNYNNNSARRMPVIDAKTRYQFSELDNQIHDRCGDALAFRVCDFYDKNGNFAEVSYISEDKTDKVRPVYVNKAIRTVIELVIREKNLTEENYVFATDGNIRSYLLDFKYNADGNIEDAVTTFEKKTRMAISVRLPRLRSPI